eukprot:767992-Hanusia_phi.AAC.2
MIKREQGISVEPEVTKRYSSCCPNMHTQLSEHGKFVQNIVDTLDETKVGRLGGRDAEEREEQRSTEGEWRRGKGGEDGRIGAEGAVMLNALTFRDRTRSVRSRVSCGGLPSSRLVSLHHSVH